MDIIKIPIHLKEYLAGLLRARPQFRGQALFINSLLVTSAPGAVYYLLNILTGEDKQRLPDQFGGQYSGSLALVVRGTHLHQVEAYHL